MKKLDLLNEKYAHIGVQWAVSDRYENGNDLVPVYTTLRNGLRVEAQFDLSDDDNSAPRLYAIGLRVYTPKEELQAMEVLNTITKGLKA